MHIPYRLRNKLSLALVAAVLMGGGSALRAFDLKIPSSFSMHAPVATPPAGTLEVGFSPEGSARELVLRMIRSTPSGTPIHVLAYVFTSKDVAQALLERQKAGSQVWMVVDHKECLTGRSSQYSIAALNALALAGAKIRSNSTFPILHDKFVVAGNNVQWGSFNYSAAAASKNSENATVAWGNPGLAKQYAAHWQSRWDSGSDYRTSF